MAPATQKASDRPITFVLHDMAARRKPIVQDLVIRPEDLSLNKPSRVNVTQTMGGAWADSFGVGTQTLQIAGHTGWGLGDTRSGGDEFRKLHGQCCQQWHNFRAEAIKDGKDPDLVKMIFLDQLDQIEWVVAPTAFSLKRNKSRPLLMQYQIGLVWVSSDVAETKAIVDRYRGSLVSDLTRQSGLDSLMASIDKIEKAAKSKISSVLGPAQKAFDDVLGLTARGLRVVSRASSAVTGVTGAAGSGVFSLVTSLTRAAGNISSMVAATVSMPMRIKAQFQTVAAALENAFCVLSNALKPSRVLPNYEGLYGASNCSSTAGGSPISVFDTQNPFPILLPAVTPEATVSPAASAAINEIIVTDPVLVPMALNTMNRNMTTISKGVMFNA